MSKCVKHSQKINLLILDYGRWSFQEAKFKTSHSLNISIKISLKKKNTFTININFLYPQHLFKFLIFYTQMYNN